MVFDREVRVERDAVGEVADVAEYPGNRGVDVHAVKRYRAGVRAFGARYGAEKRGLAGAVGADDGADARIEGEGHAGKGRGVAVAPDEFFDLKHRTPRYFPTRSKEKIDAVYDVLNDIDQQVQSQPINVEEVSNKIENLKNIANAMFEDVENKSRDAKMAERSLVALNRDRDEQDVNQAATQLEGSFYRGDFASVYSQANSLFKNRHSENGD